MDMPKVADALSFLESVAPQRWAFNFDNVGLLVGARHEEIKGVAFALDASEALVDFAQSFGANLLITHHPIFFNGTKNVNCSSADGRLVLSLAKAGMSLIAAHTNWDCAPGGQTFGIDSVVLVWKRSRSSLFENCYLCSGRICRFFIGCDGECWCRICRKLSAMWV